MEDPCFCRCATRLLASPPERILRTIVGFGGHTKIFMTLQRR